MGRITINPYEKGPKKSLNKDIKTQDKEIEITSNGTTEVTPDEGFNYLNSVSVRTNVGGQGDSASSWKYFDVSQLSIPPSMMNMFHIVKCYSYNDNSIYIKSPNELNNYNVLAVGIDTSRLISSEVMGLSNGLITGEEFLATDVYDGFSVLQVLTESGFVEIAEDKFYNRTEGAFIQHIDGTLYTSDQWTAGGFGDDKINGIAVISQFYGVNLIMAKSPIGEMPWSSIPNTLIEGVTNITDRNNIYLDRTGIKNTELIAAVDPESAAAACANYIFPNGQKGYLVTPREAEAIKGYFYSEFFDAIRETIDNPIIWTSTQYDASDAWYVKFGINDVSMEHKDKDLLVWPVCTLENY